MNIIFYFGIVCACAVHVHSMRNEAPTLNDLLFFNGLYPLHRETKNEANVQSEVPLEAANEIDASSALLDLFSPRNKDKDAKDASSNTDKYIDVSEILHDLSSTPAQNDKKEEQKKMAPLNFKEIEMSELLKDIFPQKDEGVKVVPLPPKKADKEIDISELFRGLSPAPEKQAAQQETKASSMNEKEISISEMLHDLFPEKNEGVKMVQVSPKKADEGFDISELFRGLNSVPEGQVVEQETKASSQDDKEINISEMLHDLFPQEQVQVQKVPEIVSKKDEGIDLSELLSDLFPQKEQKVNMVPKSATKTNDQIDISELFRDLVSGPKEMPRPSANAENDIEISKFLNNLVSPQNVESIEVIPMSSPKIEKESDIPELLVGMLPQPEEPKEPEQPVIVEIEEEEIISIMPLNSMATDEKRENSPEVKPEPNLTSKINDLISDVVSPLEQRLLDEFERALVPLNDVIELGEDIKNSPFTEAEIKKLGLFKVYMQTTQELYSEFKTQVHAFGVNRFYETAVHTHYHLSKQQKSHTITVLTDTTERVKAESKAIYDLILKPENQQLIKSIENKKLELSASLRAISLALKANYAHLIDDDKMEDVKTKSLSIIYENSKSMIELLQSKALETLKDGIVRHVDKLVDIMNKLPMRITLAYMF